MVSFLGDDLRLPRYLLFHRELFLLVLRYTP